MKTRDAFSQTGGSLPTVSGPLYRDISDDHISDVSPCRIGAESSANLLRIFCESSAPT